MAAGTLLPLAGCMGAEGGSPWALVVGPLALVAVALGGLAAWLAFRLGRLTGGATGAGQPADHASAPPPAPAPDTADPTEWLQAWPGPAVLLRATGTGWRLGPLNDGAHQAWPDGAEPGTDAWPPGLTAPVGEAPRQAQPLGPGWRWLAVPGTSGLALAWPWPPAAAAEDGAEARDTARQAESESYGFTLSHDLRAPLRVVEGFTRIVKEDYGAQLDRVGNDHLERVLGAAARMNLMIDAMLALARLSQQPLSRQPVNLSQLAGFVVDELRRGAPEHVAEVEIEPGLVVNGDPTLLRLVLENLLGNAWKYSAKAATPRIELRRAALAAPGRLGFVVRDNGAGFDMRSADRLFGLFQRLHSASDFPGHGVGLASVRRIVERHGGRIWAEAEPGRGASFHVELAA